MSTIKLLTTLLLSISLPLSSFSQSLRIVSGARDTVYQSKSIITGATTPGSSVYFNDQEVKVYKTGSFGWQGELVEGNNTIYVKAITPSTEVLIDTLNIFYSTGERPKREFPLVVEKDTTFYVTTLPGAYLNFGLGTDRLGGTKANYIPEGIVLKVVQDRESLYKIQLSETRFAYIPKEYTDSTDLCTSPSLTSSWMVANKGDYDRVTVSLDSKLPFIVHQELYPSVLLIDLYGAKCNSNWITQYLDLEMVKCVDLEQIETDVFRVKIYMNSEYTWGYSIKYDNNVLTVDVKHTPNLSLKGMTVGIDAGHGGSELGAVSTSGIKEKEMNLSMAYMLKKELEKRGATVVLSRTDDYKISIAERKEIFLANDIDIMISIHCNAGGNPFLIKGASTYYRHIHNRTFATVILKRLLEVEGVHNFGLIGNFNFSLIAPTEYPCILIETQFMNSFEDEERISDPEFRLSLMKKAAQGLDEYIKICKKDALSN